MSILTIFCSYENFGKITPSPSEDYFQFFFGWPQISTLQGVLLLKLL